MKEPNNRARDIQKNPFGFQTSFHLDYSFLKPNNIIVMNCFKPCKYKPVTEC